MIRRIALFLAALAAPQFADYIRAEHAKWGAAVRDAGIKLD